jgi:hypothetical protein
MNNKPWIPKSLGTGRYSPTVAFVDSSEEETSTNSVNTCETSSKIFQNVQEVIPSETVINFDDEQNKILQESVNQQKFESTDLTPNEPPILPNIESTKPENFAKSFLPKMNNPSESRVNFMAEMSQNREIRCQDNFVAEMSQSREISAANTPSSASESSDEDDYIPGSNNVQLIKLPKKPERKLKELSRKDEFVLNQKLIADLKMILSFEESVKNKQELYWLEIPYITTPEIRERLKKVLQTHHQMPVDWISATTIEICILSETKMEREKKNFISSVTGNSSYNDSKITPPKSFTGKDNKFPQKNNFTPNTSGSKSNTPFKKKF